MEQLYREVKASERLPDRIDGKHTSNYVHIIHFGNIAEAGQYDYDEGEWFNDEFRQLNKVEYWLEPLKHPPSTPQVPSKSAKEFLESVQAEHFYEHGVYFDTFSKIAEVMEQYAHSKTPSVKVFDGIGYRQAVNEDREKKIRKTLENIYDKNKNKGKMQFIDAVLYYITVLLIRPHPTAQERYYKAMEHISNMKDDSGREGCTYGDTDHDSISAVYGYNLAIEHVVEWLKSGLNK